MNLQGLIAKPRCPRRHSVKSYDTDPRGEWIRGDEGELFVLIVQSDRRLKYVLRCSNCGHNSGALPRAVVDQWGLLARRRYPYDEVIVRKPRQYPDCSYRPCDEEGREWHHFAPRNTFGYDADNWPVMPLCRAHHVEWHQRMDGYRWHRKSVDLSPEIPTFEDLDRQPDCRWCGQMFEAGQGCFCDDEVAA